MDLTKQNALVPFETPTRLTVVAATNMGKTFFVKRLLENAAGMFTQNFKTIYYHYGSAYKPIFDEMSKSIPNLVFKEGLNIEEDLAEIAKTNDSYCMVFDDLMVEINNNPNLEKLWTVHSHHYNLSIIYLTQNLFEKGKAARSISLNTSYFCLFRNYRDELQVHILGARYFLEERIFLCKHIEWRHLNLMVTSL